MSSGPCVVMVLEGNGVIERLRTLMGATDPAKAKPGTIRSEWGTKINRNVVHGSDSPASAQREIKFFFGEEGLRGVEVRPDHRDVLLSGGQGQRPSLVFEQHERFANGLARNGAVIGAAQALELSGVGSRRGLARFE